MNHPLRRAVGAALLTIACLGCKPSLFGNDKITYPEAHVGNVVETFHGTPVPDPYRWLEDVDSKETRAWIAAENKLTSSYLEGIDGRERIRARLTDLWNYERYGVPFKEGNRYFFTRNDGLQPQSVLYVTGALNAEPRVLLDPNTLSSDGTVALSGISVSPDGRYLAYSTSSGGSDWQEWKVREVSTGNDLADDLKWSKFSGASWSGDGAGFYYSRFDQPRPGQELKAVNRFQKVYFHRLGTVQARDRLVYERPDHDDWTFGTQVSDDGHYLIITVSKGTDRRKLLFYEDLRARPTRLVELVNQFEAGFRFVGNDGPVFYLWTDLDAPNARLVAVDTRHNDRSGWKDIIPEADDALRSVSMVGDTFIASYLTDAHSRVTLFDSAGAQRGNLQLPGIGTAYGFQGRRRDTETFYQFTSFITPGTVYRLQLSTLESSVFKRPTVAFDPNDYVTDQYFCTSKDCTRVPIFVTHRKGIRHDGVNPTLLYGYGGFDISITPRFSVSRLVWLELGGVYAVATLRGGGEYGEKWHRAGMLKNKQNVFNDFISSAEWLIDSRITSPKKLAIAGSSNGGLLIGAVLNQRPDLFGAALPDVGVMDMLRFNKFTIGWAWTSDYGSPEDPAMFPVLRAYSPYHNIRPGTYYPATLITTADHDDRVFPAHSFKYAARLQAAQGGPAPILIRIETRAGHGAGKPTAKRIDEAADSLAFLVKNLGVAVPPWSSRQR
ncbi:MAG: prolyl oligopeptidase family serine peptidase [Acidobacteria bacterium]|jgi:prolyl oligopeptidase|nr:prolyl oligopeptidase family serine peptidase [Acidobacteriota bacterium]